MEIRMRRGIVLATIMLAALVWTVLCAGTAEAQRRGAGDACEKKKGLVILIEFPDIRPSLDKAAVTERFKRLNAYVREMSYGKVCVEVDMTGWYRLPEPMGAYAISSVNLEVDKSRVVKLIQNAIDLADGTNDFSRYSFIVLFLNVEAKDYGMVGLCGYPGMLGWKQDAIFKTRSGQVVPGGVAAFTTQAHLGTLFHDTAHVWGGVRDGKRGMPCLYDHDIQAKHPTRSTGFPEALINMGYWDPMSCHFYKAENPPPGISSWSKLRLGWMPPGKVRTVDLKRVSEVVLDPLEDGAGETLVIKVPISDSEFYLIENRQPIGVFDSHLPGKGILIMRADDNIAECRHGQSPIKLMNADPSVPHLQGAAFDLPARPVFTNKQDNIEVRLLEKRERAYKIRIGPALAP
jgi:M6 family metalloprotease-like protein